MKFVLYNVKALQKFKHAYYMKKGENRNIEDKDIGNTEEKSLEEKENTKGMDSSNMNNTNELIVKSVDVFGDNIIAAQDKDGVIWAGVRWFGIIRRTG